MVHSCSAVSGFGWLVLRFWFCPFERPGWLSALSHVTPVLYQISDYCAIGYMKKFSPRFYWVFRGFSGSRAKKRPEGNHPHRARGFPRNQNRTERIRCDHKELYQMAGRARNIVRASSCRPCIRPSCSCRRCSFPSCRSRRCSFRPSASRRFRPSPTSRAGP